MKRFVALFTLLTFLLASTAGAASFYWKDTLVGLQAIGAEGDRGVVITSAGAMIFYYRNASEWVVAPPTNPASSITAAMIADNSIKNADVASDAAIAATKVDLSAYAPLVSPVFTTPNIGSATGSISGNAGTASALASDPSDCGGGQYATGIAASGNLTCSTPAGSGDMNDLSDDTSPSLGGNLDGMGFSIDNVTGISIAQAATGGYVMLREGSGNGTDNIALGAPDSVTTSYGVVLPSAKCGDGTTLLFAADNTTSCSTALGTGAYATIANYATVNRTKTFSFAIDNVVATDNVLMWRAPVAITITKADCYATTDNVVGNLMECSTSDVTSCTVLDAWTVTNAVDPFTDSSMTDGAVAAGAWVRWSTTSLGTASMNRLSCTVQYNE